MQVHVSCKLYFKKVRKIKINYYLDLYINKIEENLISIMEIN